VDWRRLIARLAEKVAGRFSGRVSGSNSGSAAGPVGGPVKGPANESANEPSSEPVHKPVPSCEWPGSSLGDAGEKLAERELQRLGYKILARQHRNSMGEIDLIALDGDRVVFVEVKTRRSSDRGNPVEAVDRRKQAQLTRLALVYLKGKGWLERPSRFDVVAVVWSEAEGTPEVVHYKNAFEAVGRGQFYS
jgi:putative endonuclease